MLLSCKESKQVVVRSVICLVGLWCAHGAQAQGGLETAEAVFTTSFKAKLPSAVKFAVVPDLPTLDTVNAAFNYDKLPEHRVATSLPSPVLRPLTLDNPPPPVASRYYLKAGFGSPWSPLVEASYHNGVSDRRHWGATYRHHSANNRALAHQRFSQHQLQLAGTTFTTGGLALGGALGYDANAVHYYGYHPDGLSFTRRQVWQQFHTLSANIHASNATTNESDWNYNIQSPAHRITDRSGAEEWNVHPQLLVEKVWAKKHSLYLHGGYNYTRFRDTLVQQLGTPWFRPTFVWVGNQFRLRAGAYVAYNQRQWIPLPDVELALYLAEGTHRLYAGWQGEVQFNTLRSFTTHNPFMRTAFALHNTVIQQRYVGVAGQIGTRFEYDLRGAQMPTLQAPLWINDSTDFKIFTLAYDTLMQWRGQAAIRYYAAHNWEVLATGAYNHYTTRVAAAAWHLPVYEANLGIQYHRGRLGARFEGYALSGMAYRNEQGAIAALPTIFDLNIGFTYQLSKGNKEPKNRKSRQYWALFFDANNLLGRGNSRWYRYPMYGFNVMGGITYRY